MTQVLALVPTPIEIDFRAVRDAFDAGVTIADARIGAWDANGLHHAVEIDARDALAFAILVERSDAGWSVASVTIAGDEDEAFDALAEADERMCVFIARLLCGEEGYDEATLALRGSPDVGAVSG